MAAKNMQNILKEYIAFKIYIQIENVLLNCNNVLLLHFWSNKCSSLSVSHVRRNVRVTD